MTNELRNARFEIFTAIKISIKVFLRRHFRIPMFRKTMMPEDPRCKSVSPTRFWLWLRQLWYCNRASSVAGGRIRLVTGDSLSLCW
jgi:hypothetical protein